MSKKDEFQRNPVAANDREAVSDGGDVAGGRSDFGEKLDTLIRSRGLTHAAFKQSLKEAHGVHPTTVDSWLHGKTMPRQRALSAIADVLQVEPPILTLSLSELNEKVAFLGHAATPLLADGGGRGPNPVRGALALAGEDDKSRQFIGTYRLYGATGGAIGTANGDGPAGLAVAELVIKPDRESGLLGFRCSIGADNVTGYVHISDTCLSLVGTLAPSGDFVSILIDKFPAQWGRGTHTGLYCAPSPLHRGAPVAQKIAMFGHGRELDDGELASLADRLTAGQP
jgi:hypothetical protein